MKDFMSQEDAKKIKEQYPVGTRIELENMSGENDMPNGLQGSVNYVDDAGQIGMKWDNGRSLSLVLNEDSFHIIRDLTQQQIEILKDGTTEKNVMMEWSVGQGKSENLKDRLKVLVVEPQNAPYIMSIESDYKAMQKIVEGSIEYVALPDGKCHLYCNDEGKLDGLAGNRRMDNGEIICGTFFICASNGYGDDISLTDEQIAHYTERFSEPELYTEEEATEYVISISSATNIEEFFKMMGINNQADDEIER